MKQLIFINLALLLLSTNIHAATINVGNIENIYVADVAAGSSNSSSCESSQTAANCDFEQTFHAGTYLSNTALNALVTSNFMTSVKSPVKSNATIDLAFTDNIVNGIGNDLVLFFIGNTTSFGLDVYDQAGGLINKGVYTIKTPTYDSVNNTVLDFGDTVRDSNGDWLCINSTDPICAGGYALSAIQIDFGTSFEGTAIGSLHITLGNGYNGLGSSNFSLAGGFHTSATVVPLPLSIILFSSGLALLGLTGRRKRS